MRKKTPFKPKVKDKYKVTNWKAYNKSLCNRGNVTVWMEEGFEKKWMYQGQQNRGGKIEYSAMAIEFCYTLRCIYALAYRQTEGFVRSIFRLSNIDLSVPCYTQIQRRARQLPAEIRGKRRNSKERIDIVIDSTGLKVYGEGEWKVRQHGYSKHRSWRKLHLSVDEATQEIQAVVLTEAGVDDAAMVKPVLEKIKGKVKKFGGDGAYDKTKVYDTLEKEKIKPIIPPMKNARIGR